MPAQADSLGLPLLEGDRRDRSCETRDPRSRSREKYGQGNYSEKVRAAQTAQPPGPRPPRPTATSGSAAGSVISRHGGAGTCECRHDGPSAGIAKGFVPAFPPLRPAAVVRSRSWGSLPVTTSSVRWIRFTGQGYHPDHPSGYPDSTLDARSLKGRSFRFPRSFRNSGRCVVLAPAAGFSVHPSWWETGVCFRYTPCDAFSSDEIKADWEVEMHPASRHPNR